MTYFGLRILSFKELFWVFDVFHPADMLGSFYQTIFMMKLRAD
jgi:hypothetical protein